MVQIVLQNNGCTNLINKRFVASCFLSDTAFDDSSVGNNGCKPLVKVLYGDVRKLLFPLRNELFDPLKVLAWLAIEILWFTNNNEFNILFCRI